MWLKIADLFSLLLLLDKEHCVVNIGVKESVRAIE